MAGPVQSTTGPQDDIVAKLEACEAVFHSRDARRALELGRALETEQPKEARVLVAVARMYLEAGLSSDAKRAIDAAGRALAAVAYDSTPVLEFSEEEGSLPHFSLPDLEPPGLEAPEPSPSPAAAEPLTKSESAAPPRLVSSVPAPPKRPVSAPPAQHTPAVTLEDFEEEEDKTVVNLPKPDEEPSLPRFSMPSSVTESSAPFSTLDEENTLHRLPRLAPAVLAARVARHYESLKGLLGRLRLPERMGGSTFKIAAVSGAALALGLVAWAGFAYSSGSGRYEAARQRLDEADKLMTSLNVEDLQAAEKRLLGPFEPDGAQATFGWLFGGFGDLEPRASALRARRQMLLSLVDPNAPADLKALDSAATNEANAAELAAPQLFVAARERPDQLKELLQTWDPKLEQDALYQLAAGIALDRLGDPGSLERYDAARRIDAKLLIAEAMYAQAALLLKDPSEAEPEVSSLRERSRTEPTLVPLARALAALGWAVRDDRGPVPSEQSELRTDDRLRLPPALTAARLAVDLVVTLEDEDEDVELRTRRALRLVEEAETPALATVLGKIAFGMGRDAVAERALSRARKLAERYTPASVVQAELDLLKGRFAAAKKSIDGAGSAVETNAVQAVVAYERLDLKTLEKKLAGLDTARFSALRLARGVLTGETKPSDGELESLSRSGALWANLIAVDAALDGGRIALADKLAAGWKATSGRPTMLLRVGRLKRYQSHLGDAVKLTTHAYEALPDNGRALIEHAFALVAAGRAEQALSITEDKPPVGEPAPGWLEGFLVGAKNGWVAGSIKIGFLRLPEEEGIALPWRLGVARALAVAGDPRAYRYLEKLSETAPRHPDLITAKNEL